ncbi:hypothetical protein Mucpa_6912 [Mucilaginibacter paludis DSM 18603]|uniref:TonB-dependent receptor n=2 Tax=Mucilaginibacter TaxID=423349 RepID=H1Y416_9SPHI|nr:hypothetical protein Mucpa_6912 [Mucilaginibacter paludis DSM 18603]
MYRNSNGSCTYSIVRSTSNADPVVTGKIYEYGTTVALKTTGAIRVDGKVMGKTDAEGKFSFALQPGTYRFEAVGIPYQTFETQKIKVESSDSIKLNIYVKLYKNPLQ